MEQIIQNFEQVFGGLAPETANKKLEKLNKLKKPNKPKKLI